MENEGVDISGPKAYLLMARSAFDEESYDRIENFLARGQDEFINLKNDYQQEKVTKSIDRAESILTNARKRGFEDTSKIEEINHMLERAKKARDENDFEQAVEYAVNARKSADALIEESSERDAAQEALDSLDNVVMASKRAGVDVTSIENMLAKSKSAFEDGDYLSTQTITEDIQKMMDKLRKPFQTQISSNNINTAQTYITEVKEFGAEVSEAEDILRDAKSLFESEEFEQAESKANEAMETARTAKRKKQAEMLKEPFEESKTFINNVKSIGTDVSDALGFLQEADDALHKLDIEIAEELIARARNVAEEARDKYLMDIANEAIALTEKQLEEAEELGVDTTDVKRMLTQAMEMFEDHEYIKAEQYASNASDLLEETRKKHTETMAMDVYKKAGELSAELQALGADVAGANVHMKLANESFNKQDYILLRAHSQNTIDVLNDLKQPYLETIVKDAISMAEQQIDAAKSFGVDITEAQNLLSVANNNASQNFWNEAEENAKKAATLAEDSKNLLYKNQIKTEINSLRGSIVNLESSGVDTTEVSSFLQKAEIALEGKNFTHVGKFMKMARDWVKKASEQKNRDKVEEIILYSQALLSYIKNNIQDITKDIQPAVQQLKMAKKAFKAHKYTLAEKSANNSKVLVEKIKHPQLEQFLFVFKSLQTEEMLNSVRNIISDLKKKNIDAQEVSTFLKKAEFAFESDETYEKGKDYIIEAKLRAKEAMNKYQSKIASKSISAAQSQIISIKRMGVNVKEAEILLEKSKIAFKAQEFSKSKMMAEKVILTLKKAKRK
jgi:hypothetical protein